MPLVLKRSHLGDLQDPTRHLVDRLAGEGVIARLWNRDHTVWKPDPAEIASRLGWLDCPATMPASLGEIDALVESVRRAGLTHALLLGMGGSSLAPEVFRAVFGAAPGYPDLAVLDSTEPGAVLAVAERLDPRKTLYIPATKSGGTVETISLLKYFYNRAREALGDAVGDHFVAITDPGSGLAEMAAALGFRHTFLNDPDIGGRYSALSMFGLVPARLLGLDVDRLLQRARAAAARCAVERDNPAAELGALMGAAAATGRDKLTLLLSPGLAALGAWVEQLIAESTGKEGRGILPVDGEPVGAPELYGTDRLFVHVCLAGDRSLDAAVAALAAAGHPVARIEMGDLYDLGGEFLQWEISTAVAGAALAINPFDQPNVEAAKVLARSMTEAYRRDGALPAPAPALTDGALAVYGQIDATTLEGALRQFLSVPGHVPAPYVAIQAYVCPAPETDAALTALRVTLRDRLHLATTVGYGPRFLHSTGQLHKGDGGHGLFLQLAAGALRDAAIPDRAGQPQSSMSFGVLVSAQALGDSQALEQAGRRVLRVHLGADVTAGLQRLSAAVAAALT
ncbi:MAG: glucose-6-phosphate isomerase [Gemmatimonadota bacterium]